MDWFEAEWATTADAAVIEGAVMAANGIGKHYQGRVVDPRYDFTKARIIADLGITEPEMICLGLETLVTKAVASDNRRRAKGVDTLEARREKGATLSEKARRPWEELGISRASYYRRKADARAEGVQPSSAQGRSREAWSAETFVRLIAVAGSKRMAREEEAKAEEETQRKWEEEEARAHAAGLMWNPDACPWDESTYWIEPDALAKVPA
jgi:hypothetical protein